MSKIKIIAVSLLALLGILAGCTPEEQALWNQYKEKVQVEAPVCTDKFHTKLEANIANCHLTWKIAQEQGIGYDDFLIGDFIIMRESAYKVDACGPSGDWGIPQALPGDKMKSEGADWKTNPVTQIKWFFKYIKSRYKTFAAAYRHKVSKGWY